MEDIERGAGGIMELGALSYLKHVAGFSLSQRISKVM